jgi:hypothetical protein
MQTQQAHVLFHLTGKQIAGVQSLNGASLRPALLATYRDLTVLRYDFPLVLIESEEEPVQSLSGLFDRALAQIGGERDGGRLRKHALRLEREIRALAAESGGALYELWERAGGRLSVGNDASLRDGLDCLRAAVGADGEVVDCNGEMPFRLWQHLWELSERKKARSFRAEIDSLVMRLSEILRAELARSEAGLAPARLAASIGDTQREMFDFGAMSRLLVDSLAASPLPEPRRARIRSLLSVLQSQRFFVSTGQRSIAGAEPYGFVFESCADAVEAYRERLPKLLELAKAMLIARLVVAGEYDETKHDRLFEELDTSKLDAAELAAFPSYLVRIRGAETRRDLDNMLPALAAGLPAKVLVQTDDLLEPSPIDGEPLGLALHTRELVSAATGIGGFCVMQSSASHLFRFRDRVLRALICPGPALLSVFSGANTGGIPPYLAAAMAMESRIFPTFIYNPSAGSDWASRFSLEGNPQPELDWPMHKLEYEDETHQRMRERLAFTFADFAAGDLRYAAHFAAITRSEWDESLIAVSEFAVGTSDDRSKIPYVLLVDRDNVLRRAIVDDHMVREMRRCAATWHNLQELGGIHNSHAERLVEQERKKWAEQSERTGQSQVGSLSEPAAPDSVPPTTAITPEDAGRQQPSDDPWIETARCTSCNECIQINGKMFGYDANKQATILNPDAGTYRQLVEAAESCQVAIIHPGKPRNSEEPGLDELKARAELYL